MITCNRCGSISPASAINCQNCGAPLSSNIENGLSQPRFLQEQPELPAWLESLRAGERPATPADNNPANFSTADLIEQGSLPSWMRSERPEMSDTSLSSPHLSLRSSSAPGPNTDDSRGLNAKSLIDEHSLPSWMQENKQSASPEGGITASSLVQQDLMPDWMKSLQPPPSNPNPAMPSARPVPSPAPVFREQSAPFPITQLPNEIPVRPAQGFSASDLVDQQALPSWMAQQENKGSATVQPGAAGLISPSSLVDVNSLPPWLQENAQQERKSGVLPPVQTNQPWQSAQSPMQQTPFGQSASLSMQPGSPVWQSSSTQLPPLPMNNASAQGGGLSASSFIDQNGLPEWMRSGIEPQNQPGVGIPTQWSPANNMNPGSAIPSRPDNIRVPSRPRGEVNANESNEAAANVFASMLGVASTAPHFPGSPPQQGYGMQGNPLGQGIPPSSTQGPPASNSLGLMTGGPTGFTGPQNMQRPQQGQGYASGGFNPGAYPIPDQQGQGNYPGRNPGMPSYGANNSGMLPPSNMVNPNMDANGGEKTSKKPAKKSVFDMIRDWFR